MKNEVRYRVTNRNLSNRKEVEEVYYYEAKPPIYPLLEKYSFMSSYAYCNNNPTIYIDSPGMEDWIPDNDGNLAAEAGVR